MTFTIMFDATEYNTISQGASATPIDKDMVQPFDCDETIDDEEPTNQDNDLEYNEFKNSKSDKLCRLYLWYFLLELLEMEGTDKIISWTNKETLEFKIHDAKSLSLMWGNLHGRENMTYAKLSRALRYHYKKGVLRKVHKKRYCYQFLKCPKVRYVMEENAIKNKTKFNEKVKHEVLAQSSTSNGFATKPSAASCTSYEEPKGVKTEVENILRSLENNSSSNSSNNDLMTSSTSFTSQISIASDDSSDSSENDNANVELVFSTSSLNEMDFSDIFAQHDSSTTDHHDDEEVANESVQSIINELASELQEQVNQFTLDNNEVVPSQQEPLVLGYEQYTQQQQILQQQQHYYQNTIDLRSFNNQYLSTNTHQNNMDFGYIHHSNNIQSNENTYTVEQITTPINFQNLNTYAVPPALPSQQNNMQTGEPALQFHSNSTQFLTDTINLFDH